MILINDILDSEPPPVYSAATATTERHNGNATLSSADANGKLPAVLWLKVFSFVALEGNDEGVKSEGRSFLHTDARFVCKAMYIGETTKRYDIRSSSSSDHLGPSLPASMSLLRTHYLPSYLSQVRPPFTTDPWPATSSSSSLQASSSACRETKVLDLFIAVETKRDVEHFQSDLLEQPGMGNLFDLHQPRARLEDLATQRGLLSGHLLSSISQPEEGGVEQRGAGQVRAQDISVAFALRKVELRLPMATSSGNISTRDRRLPRRTVLTVERTRTTTLEETADVLLAELARIPLRAMVAGTEEKPVVWYVEDETLLKQKGMAPLHPQQQQQSAAGSAGREAGKPSSATKSRVSNWFKKAKSNAAGTTKES